MSCLSSIDRGLFRFEQMSCFCCLKVSWSLAGEVLSGRPPSSINCLGEPIAFLSDATTAGSSLGGTVRLLVGKDLTNGAGGKPNVIIICLHNLYLMLYLKIILTNYYKMFFNFYAKIVLCIEILNNFSKLIIHYNNNYNFVISKIITYIMQTLMSLKKYLPATKNSCCKVC